ncbi:MAG: hypothetical protein PVJ83_06865 [Gammaproteobacteria bacterium]|jgi:hypothetical protein
MTFVDDIRLELATGGGDNIDALLKILGVGDNEKSAALKMLKELSEEHNDNLDFAKSIVDHYTVKSQKR